MTRHNCIIIRPSILTVSLVFDTKMGVIHFGVSTGNTRISVDLFKKDKKHLTNCSIKSESSQYLWPPGARFIAIFRPLSYSNLNPALFSPLEKDGNRITFQWLKSSTQVSILPGFCHLHFATGSKQFVSICHVKMICKNNEIVCMWMVNGNI